ncbi:hypothetical protein FDK38_003522 [Candidozyma auris]|nr:hypothetical protein FDK38_003522 [[Candida] auris]
MSSVYAAKGPMSGHPYIPGSWGQLSPRLQWAEPPKTLNPSVWKAPKMEVDMTDQWRLHNDDADGSFELQSLKSISPSSPSKATSSSPYSSRVFSPEAMSREYDELLVRSPSHDDMEAHMTTPLIPSTEKLDFSCLIPKAGLVMARAAGPLSSCVCFDQSNKTDETALLGILNEEFMRIELDVMGPEIASRPSDWKSLFKELVVGLSDQEYHEKYYWAKYAGDCVDESQRA